MDRKDCFGSLKEVSLSGGQTMTQSRPECRSCEEIRDCLRYTKQIDDEKKEKEELRKQNLITQIIDHSYVFSNELGSCILKFLGRIYSSSLGASFSRISFYFLRSPGIPCPPTFPISISRTMIDLFRGEKDEPEPSNPQARPSTTGARGIISTSDHSVSEIFSEIPQRRILE